MSCKKRWVLSATACVLLLASLIPGTPLTSFAFARRSPRVNHASNDPYAYDRANVNHWGVGASALLALAVGGLAVALLRRVL